MGRFEGRTDVAGFIKRFSRSIARSSHDAGSDESGDEAGDLDILSEGALADELGREGEAEQGGVEVVGTPGDGGIDLDFRWAQQDAEPGPSSAAFTGSLPEPGRESEETQGQAGGGGEPLRVPPLAVVMLVCGTRGDVQPFIALGLKLQEYGHRVRLATHKVYRSFVQEYGLEYYPLGGDPKVLSDFIVKHRGVFTIDTKDAFANLREVDEVVSTCFDACTLPDPEGSGEPFVAQAIIANPPSFGGIHCAEKLQLPLTMLFTMPWTPTRSFPHPLARIRNVRDRRPSSIAVRNYLSYVVVAEYTYAGVSGAINRFRRNVLHLPPIRLGNSGATLVDAHRVPFIYCWSPSLVPKPADWDSYVDVTGYLFLGEGARSSYRPDPSLAAFLAAGPPPVYLGFGSLMVDDKERLTRKILDAFAATGQRLLLSKGWAGLGEGVDLPDTVLLLDDVPHDWLLPQCSAVVHHGGAGTTAAGLLAACPTLVVPFFGDQTFWGSAVHMRGVGPRPIPIDRLTTARLAAALEHMQRPEVKQRALEVSRLIAGEDGLEAALQAFHRHLPAAALRGEPVPWHLAKPTVYSFFSEVGGGIADLFVDPVKGAREEGVKGAFKGMGRGLGSVVTRPLQGCRMSGYSIWQTLHTEGDTSSQHSQAQQEEQELPKAGKDGGSSRSLSSLFCFSASNSFMQPSPSKPGQATVAHTRLHTESAVSVSEASLTGSRTREELEQLRDDEAVHPPPLRLTQSFRFSRAASPGVPAEQPAVAAAGAGQQPVAAPSQDAAPT